MNLLKILSSTAISFGVFAIFSYSIAEDPGPYRRNVKLKKRYGAGDAIDEASWESFPASDPPSW